MHGIMQATTSEQAESAEENSYSVELENHSDNCEYNHNCT